MQPRPFPLPGSSSSFGLSCSGAMGHLHLQASAHPALSEYALIAKPAEASHSRPRCFNGLSFRAELFATLPLCRRPVCECCVYSTEQPPLPCKCKGFRTHRQSINQQVFVPALIKPGMHGATLGFVMSISAIFRAHGEQL